MSPWYPRPLTLPASAYEEAKAMADRRRTATGDASREATGVASGASEGSESKAMEDATGDARCKGDKRPGTDSPSMGSEPTSGTSATDEEGDATSGSKATGVGGALVEEDVKKEDEDNDEHTDDAPEEEEDGEGKPAKRSKLGLLHVQDEADIRLRSSGIATGDNNKATGEATGDDADDEHCSDETLKPMTPLTSSAEEVDRMEDERKKPYERAITA